MNEAIAELRALRLRYKAAGKLREAKAMGNAINLLMLKKRDADEKRD